MDYNMPMAAKQHTPSEYTYNRRPKGLYDTSRPYFNSGCSSCLSIFLILMGAGLLGLEIALIVLEGHVARTYVCGIWAGILAMITGALCATAAKSQKTKVIIGMIGFSLLSLGGGIAVGFISYEAIDWDADDFGDGDGKRIARLACEAVRAFCALWVILMSFAAIIIGLKSMCSSDEEVIYHKFHDEYSKNTPVPPHYIQSNTLTKDDPLPEPEPEEVNEEPIRKKKQNETKATPRPTEEHPHAYENHLMAESPEQRDKRWGSHVKEVEPVQKKDDYGPLPSANPNTKRHASIPNVDEPNTLYVPSNTGFVMVKSKNSAPNSVIGGSMNNINAASTSPPTAAPAVAPVSTPNLAPADNYDTAKGQLPATHYYEPSPATTVVGAQTPGTTVQTAGYRPPSPGKGKRSRSPSPKRKRTPSPKRHSRRRSPSPGKGKRSRTPSPKRKRTPSPKRHSRRRSPKRKASPKRRSRSPSPVEYAGYD